MATDEKRRPSVSIYIYVYVYIHIHKYIYMYICIYKKVCKFVYGRAVEVMKIAA